MKMKVHAINLIRRGADALIEADDGGSAYALHELANNLLTVMRGDASFEEWCDLYVCNGAQPLDLDKHMPVADERAHRLAEGAVNEWDFTPPVDDRTAVEDGDA